jgi:diaminohydroxyphosphoribosylaminopyrimidine deaminase/5-amino-6-(5-phosphoribosylamino)uracil reductase
MLLGAGRNAVASLGITTIADALRPRVTDITVLADDPEHNVRLTLAPELTAVEEVAQQPSRNPVSREET